MRITEAAQRLGTSPRMLRYRDLLGLLPPVREPAPARQHASGRPPGGATGLSRAAAGGASPGPAAGHAPAPAASHVPVPAADHAPGPVPGPAGGHVPGPAGGHAPGHRRFSEDDLAAVSLALGIEQRYDISPAALAFGLRVLTEPRVRAEVAELGRRIGRIRPLPARALEFEKERALRLLSLGRTSPTHDGGSRRSARRSTRP